VLEEIFQPNAAKVDMALKPRHGSVDELFLRRHSKLGQEGTELFAFANETVPLGLAIRTLIV
jgi:hypothetical protein